MDGRAMCSNNLNNTDNTDMGRLLSVELFQCQRRGDHIIATKSNNPITNSSKAKLLLNRIVPEIQYSAKIKMALDEENQPYRKYYQSGEYYRKYNKEITVWISERHLSLQGKQKN